MKPLFQFVAVAGIILATLADLIFKSKKIRITSLALALLAAIGVWAIEMFVKFPISEASGSATLFFQLDGADKEWKDSIGSGNESTVEIFKNDTCILKMRGTGKSAKGLGEGISVAKNEYSLSVRGSHVNSDFEDMNEIDSIVIFDPDFRSPVELIDGSLELRLNGKYYYRIGIDQIVYESKRVKIGWVILERLRINPERKTDFGGFTLVDKEMAGTWIGSGTGLGRIACGSKHTLAFDFSGDSLNIGRHSDGKSTTFSMNKF